MATLYTHAFAGLGLARLLAAHPMPWSYWAWAAILPLVPDLDVFSDAAYGSPLGHRGFTHSLAFALLMGLVAASTQSRPCCRRWWGLATIFFAITASHGLLDALTRGGQQIPFFWPFAGSYGNWGPLPVSDIAFDFPDPRTSRAVRSELLWIWAPMALLVVLSRFLRRSSRGRSRSGGPVGLP